MDRRTFLISGVCWPGAHWAAWMPTLPGGHAITRALAVVDTSLAQGAALAASLARINVHTFELADDIGMLWHAHLAPPVAQSQAENASRLWIVGLVRASDYFVLQTLAVCAGYTPDRVQTFAVRKGALQTQFALAPRTSSRQNL